MKIALITMPFISIERPSIQLGLLKAYLESKIAVEVDDLYLNLDFSDRIGADLFEPASFGGNVLLGEWLFAKAAFDHPLDTDYLDRIGADLQYLYKNISMDTLRTRLIEVRENSAAVWLDSLVKSRDWAAYDVIGFSCTFCQTNASLALARRLKEKFPHLKIIMGGSALESDMGEEIYAHCCDYIDCIIQGEGEVALLKYLEKVAANIEPPRQQFKAPALTDLNTLPPPNFDSYFELRPQATWLLVESSRGCWWGEKKHCNFCGLNGETMKYRSKNPKLYLEQINQLKSRYGRTQFEAVDNILDHRYFDTFLDQLIEQNSDYEFFYEIKANVNLPRFQKLLAAGIKNLQPGIESLSTDVLKLMNKGVSGSQNIYLLQMAKTSQITIIWNLLFGFPGETTASYEKLMAILPKLFHLMPPGYTGPLRLDRFSPYFNEYVRATRAQDLSYTKFKDVEPSPLYKFCFPTSWNYWRLAYYYSATASTEVSPSVYARLVDLVTAWQDLWKADQKPQLEFRDQGDSALVLDRRDPAVTAKAYQLRGPHLSVARALFLNPLSRESLQSECSDMPPAAIDEIVKSLIQKDLILFLDDRYLWLPTGSNLPQPQLESGTHPLAPQALQQVS